MIYTDPQTAAPAFRAKIEAAERILLLTHINPDGDAIGSLLGAYHSLQAFGKQALPLASSALPSYCAALPGVAAVQVYQAGDSLPENDLIWMLDTAALSRVGLIYDEHAVALRSHPLIIVDHHATNDGGGAVNLIATTAASCADLLFRLLRAMELPVDAAAATCLLMGTITDTQSFQTSSTSPQTLRTSADLLEAGADLRAVVNAAYFSLPASTIQLTALSLRGLRRDGPLVWASVTQAMLRESGAEDEASDDTIMRMQRIAGLRACALFKERRDGTVKLSLRSVPGINVAEIARTWGGGGHTQAAGATLMMGLTEAEAVVLPLLRRALGMPDP